MTLQEFYRAYIDCLNRQDWDELGRYVGDGVKHNGRPLGLSGYRSMLIKDFEDIPDLRFVIDRLVCDPPLIAARLMFNCSPKGQFLGLDIDGRRISFAENVFYEVKDSKIADVLSVIGQNFDRKSDCLSRFLRRPVTALGAKQTSLRLSRECRIR